MRAVNWFPVQPLSNRSLEPFDHGQHGEHRDGADDDEDAPRRGDRDALVEDRAWRSCGCDPFAVQYQSQGLSGEFDTQYQSV